MTQDNLLYRGRRIPWSFIEDKILDGCCLDTVGSYFFSLLLTAWRKNGESIGDWMTKVEDIQKGVINFGNGWDQIGSADAVLKLCLVGLV